MKNVISKSIPQELSEVIRYLISNIIPMNHKIEN